MSVSREMMKGAQVRSGNSFAPLSDDFEEQGLFYNDPSKEFDHGYTPSTNIRHISTMYASEISEFEATRARLSVQTREAQLKAQRAAAAAVIAKDPRPNRLKYEQAFLKKSTKLLQNPRRTRVDFELERNERRNALSVKEAALASRKGTVATQIRGDGKVIVQHLFGADDFNAQMNFNRDVPVPDRNSIREPVFDRDRVRAREENGGFQFSFGDSDTVYTALPKAEKTYFNKIALNVGLKTREERRAARIARAIEEKNLLRGVERRKDALARQTAQAMKEIKTKTHQVFMNGAAELLSSKTLNFARKAHPKELKRLQENARVWNQDMNYHGKQTMSTEIGSYAPTLSLSCRGRAVYDDRSLALVLKGIRDPRKAKTLQGIYDAWRMLPPVKASIPFARQLQKEFNDVSKVFEVPTHVDRPGFLERKQFLKTKGKAVLEGSTSSKMAGFDVSIDHVQFVRSLLPETNKLARTVVQFLCMCVSLQQCPSRLNLIANITSFLTSSFSEHVDAWLDWVKVAFQSVTLEFGTLQAGEKEEISEEKKTRFEEFMAGLATRFDASSVISNSAFGQALWGVLGTLSVSTILMSIGFGGDIGTAIRLKERMDKFFVGRDGLETFFQRLVRFVTVAVERIKDALTSGDWNLLFSGSSFKEWVLTAETVLNDLSIRIDGARPTTAHDFAANLKKGIYPLRITAQISSGQRADLIDSLIGEYKYHAAKFASSGDLVAIRTMENLHTRLMTERYSLRNALTNGEYRVEPFMVFIHGKPGTGKSDFTEILHKALGASRGLPVTADTRYSMIKNANFWDGADDRQWFLSLDDIDQAVGTVSHADVKHTEIVVQVVNKKPFMQEQAAVESKGKKFCNYQAVAYCTNFKLARLKGFTLEPMAFWRRCEYTVEFIVKERYATATGRLDKGKLDGSNDYWDFNLGYPDDSAWDEANKFDVFPFQEHKIESISQLMSILCRGFNRKIDNEVKRLQAVSAVETSVCPHCYISITCHPKKECHAKTEAFQFSGTTVDVPYYYLALVVGLVYYGWLQTMILIVSGAIVVDKVGAAAGVSTEMIRDLLQFEVREWLRRRHFSLAKALGVVFKTRLRTTQELIETYESLSRERVERVVAQKWVIPALAAVSAATVLAFKAFPRQATLEVYVSDGPMKQAGVDRMGYVRQMFVRDPLHEPALTTTTFDDLVQRVKSRILVLESGKNFLCGVQVYSNIVLMPCHIWETRTDMNLPQARLAADACKGGEVIVRRGTLKYPMTVVFGVNAFKAAGREYCLVRVPGLPPLTEGFNLLKHIAESTVARCSTGFERITLVSRAQDMTERVIVGQRGGVAVYPDSPLGAVYVDNIETVSGDCGGLYVVQVGKMAYVAGYHVTKIEISGFMSSSWQRIGEEITATELKILFHELNTVTQILPQIGISTLEMNSRRSGPEAEVRIVPLEERSSLWAAISQGFETGLVLGTIEPKFPLSTLKSKCVPSPLRPYLAQKEQEICGVTPYYCAPAMRGMMVEGQWKDPWIVNMLNSRDTWSDERIWRLALLDYTHGLEHLPGIGELEPLSDGEAWAGVPGLVSATNLKTSMGAPIFQRKRGYVEIDQAVPEVYIKEEVQAHIDHILATIDSGLVYVPLCAHSLKDEAVSYEKVKKMKTRVFNTLPAAYNFLLKKYFAPLAVFMMRHWRYFEAFVGKDITSYDCDELVKHLCSVFGSLSYSEQMLVLSKFFVDGDFEGYDTHLASIVRQTEAEFWRLFVGYTRYSERDQKRAWRLVLGTIITLRFVKNDVFLVCCLNPSGSNITILSNGVCNSLLFRFCYIAEALTISFRCYDLSSTYSIVQGIPLFRVVIALQTLGDDNIAGVSPKVMWFNYEVITRRMKQAGAIYTAADKRSENVDFKALTECSFLKRSFRKVEGRWQARIELKSIVKMLVFLKDSELGPTDHCAVLASNALRELYFHGRTIFEEWKLLIDEAVQDLELHRSPLWRNFTFDELDMKFKGRKYPGWMTTDREELFKIVPTRGFENVGSTEL